MWHKAVLSCVGTLGRLVPAFNVNIASYLKMSFSLDKEIIGEK